MEQRIHVVVCWSDVPLNSDCYDNEIAPDTAVLMSVTVMNSPRDKELAVPGSPVQIHKLPDLLNLIALKSSICTLLHAVKLETHTPK